MTFDCHKNLINYLGGGPVALNDLESVGHQGRNAFPGELPLQVPHPRVPDHHNLFLCKFAGVDLRRKRARSNLTHAHSHKLDLKVVDIILMQTWCANTKLM